MLQFSLIICTYLRAESILKLLNSVKKQTLYPDEILIVDGSSNLNTKQILEANKFENLKYFLVDKEDRGLTKQRNFGINKISKDIDVVCFLDDDTILEINYFEELIKTYHIKKDAVAVGGYIINDVEWCQKEGDLNFDDFKIDGFVRKLGKRYTIRKKLKLLPDVKPGVMPTFSNGYPVSFLPPTNKTYEVEFFTGCSMSFKKYLFDEICFSTYFEGYGLYEDLDFCLRANEYGNSYVNTAAKARHYHDSSGRPNKYQYGKMVVRNGWYVWRLKYSKPKLKARIKWNSIIFLQIFLRSLNIFNTKYKTEAYTEALGRFIGLFSLILKRPVIDK